MSVDTETLRKGLELTLDSSDLGIGHKYEGKVRDNYTKDGRRYIVVTDRISAFDRVIGTLPFKGQVLNSLAAFWFEETRDLVPNHVIDVPDPNVMVAVECEALPVEMIVRAYITGVTSTSIWTHYKNGARVFADTSFLTGSSKIRSSPNPFLRQAQRPSAAITT